MAKQDFVFGTSSQLVTEQSPSLLRDLQIAMRHSNRMEDKNPLSFLDSDEIGPSDLRTRLWDAAARDVDGDLLDIEVVDLVNATLVPEELPMQADPFGYFKDDDTDLPKQEPSAAVPQDDQSFADLSELLASHETLPSQNPIDFDSPLSGSQISVSTDVCPPPHPLPRNDESRPSRGKSVNLLATRPRYKLLEDPVVLNMSSTQMPNSLDKLPLTDSKL